MANDVWVPVRLSARGMIGDFVKEASGAGKQAAAALGSEMEKGGRAAGQKAGKATADGMASQKGAIARVSAQLAAARDAEADAAGQVRVAEAKLAEARASGAAGSSKVVKAEQELQNALAKQQMASGQAARASADLDKVRSGEVETARAVVRQEDALAKAKVDAGKASGQVRVAEAQLAEVRAKEGSTTAQIATAEERVDSARRKAAASADQVKTKELLLAAAHDEVAQAAQAAGQASEEHTGKLESTAETMTSMIGTAAKWGAGIAAAAGAVGTALFEVGSQFDDMDDALRIGTGASGAALEGLSQSARNVAAATPALEGGMGQIGQTMADLNTRTGATGKTLETLTSQFVELSNMGLDADINTVTQAMTGFGISADKAPAAMDELLRVSQSTGLSINDLAQSAVKGGPALRQFGFGLADSAALAGQLDKAGMDADKTMAAMTKGLSAFAKEGKAPKAALADTVAEIQKFTKAGNDVDAINMASKLFGTRGAAQFVDAVKSGAFSVEGLNAAAAGTGDTVLGLAGDTADFAEQWQLFKQNVLLKIEPIAAAVFGAISSGMAAAIPYIETAGNVVGTVLVPVFHTLGAAVSSVAGWLGDNKGAMIAIAAVATAVLAPALIMTGLHYVGVGAKAVLSGAKQVGSWVLSGQKAIWSAGVQVAQGIKVIGSWIAMGAKATAQGAQIVAGWVAAQAKAVWSAGIQVAQGVKVIGSWVAMGAKATAQGVVIAAAWVASVARAGVAAAATAAYAVAQGAVTVATGAWTAAQWLLNSAFLANPLTWIIAGIVALIAIVVVIATKTTWFQTLWSAVWNGIKAAWDFVWGALKAGFNALIGFFTQTIPNALTKMKEWFVQKWEDMKLGFSIIWNALKEKLGEVVSFFTDTIPEAAGKAKDWVLEKFDALLNWFKQLPSKMASALRGLWDGLKNGFRDAINWVIDGWNNFRLHFEFTIPVINKTVEFNVDTPNLPRLRDGGTIGATRDRNGRLRGPGTGRSDSILGVDEYGMPVVRVANGEGVVNEKAMQQGGGAVVAALNAGWVPSAEYLHGMVPGLADGGVIGKRVEPYGLPTGTDTGGYGSSGNVFPQWIHDLEQKYGVKASTYAGHQESDRGEAGYAPNPGHLNRGVDWSGPLDKMQAFAEWLLSIAPSSEGLEQIIWQNPTTGQKIGWAGRKDVTTTAYYVDDYPNHQNHVHTRQSTSFPTPAAPPPAPPEATPTAPETTATPDTTATTTPDTTTTTTTPPEATSTGSSMTWGQLAGAAVTEQLDDVASFFGVKDTWMYDPSKIGVKVGPQQAPGTATTTDQSQQSMPETATPTAPPTAEAPPAAAAPPAKEPIKQVADGSVSMGEYKLGQEFLVKEAAIAAAERGFNAEGAAIGIATELVESGDPIKMWANNADPQSLQYPHDAVGSDGTSSGPFQQQNNGAWGSVAQRMNPRGSASMFFNELKKKDWQAMDPGAAAQSVQRSAFPDRYGTQMERARQLVKSAGVFDTGGRLPHGGLALNLSGEDELVLPADTTKQLLSPTPTKLAPGDLKVVSPEESPSAGGRSEGSPLIGSLTMQAVDIDDGIRKVFREVARTAEADLIAGGRA
ncbi:phage tail tape measure protein [Gordonia sp. SND2]|uniref:phage tail tape measure protein n=1 Tax=Gordonia sp. SND2 TaxID=3388659 RepID=UPI00398A9073